MFKGLGFFLNSGDTISNPAQTSTSMSTCHTSWAALWCESPDGRKVDLNHLHNMSVALKDKGIKPWVWTFPASTDPEASAKWVVRCATLIGAQGIIIDIELPFKNKPLHADRFMATLKLEMTAARNIVPLELAFTSYPYGNSNVPWDHFKDAKIGMPQLYITAGDVASIKKSFDFYEHHFGLDVVPVCATYIDNSQRLHDDLARLSAEAVSRGRPLKAIGVWVWRTTDDAERSVLGAFAKAQWP